MAEKTAARERKILIAMDDSKESANALSWCLRNMPSENYSDTLVLLHVKPPRFADATLDNTGYVFSTDVIDTMEKYHSDLAEIVMNKAKKICSEHVKPVKVEVKVENGDPRDVICRTAEKMGVDLLVIGSHGYGLLKRALLGSVSNYCIQHARCPVAVVKLPKSNPREHRTQHEVHDD